MIKKKRYNQKTASLLAEMFGPAALGKQSPKHGYLSVRARENRKRKRNAARRRKAITKAEHKRLVKRGQLRAS